MGYSRQIPEEKTTTDLKKVLNLFEAMLCFDAWLHLPAFWSQENEEEKKRLPEEVLRH